MPADVGDRDVLGRGIPVSQGHVSGNAIVVYSSRDFKKVPPHARCILVVKNFDPNYDVLLSRCKGVVSEVGNLLCHLAIVTRVRRIPAVVQVPDVTRRVRDGEMLTLDAIRGVVYRGRYSPSDSTGIEALLSKVDARVRRSARKNNL